MRMWRIKSRALPLLGALFFGAICLPLPLAAADLDVIGPVTIGSNTSYDNVIVRNTGILTIDALLTVTMNMTVEGGGLVTHSLRDTAGLVLNVSGMLDVQSGGKIDVSAEGRGGGNNNSRFAAE